MSTTTFNLDLQDATVLQGYVIADAVLGRSQQLRKRCGGMLPPREAAALAITLQAGQNREDAAWLEELGFPEQVAEALMSRMMARGACWLELVEELVGFEGDYRFMRDDSLPAN